MIKASPIRVDDLDEHAPLDSDVIPHVGPVEGKLLEGSDGRLYALEMLRLTPRDANYLKVMILKQQVSSKFGTLSPSVSNIYACHVGFSRDRKD